MAIDYLIKPIEPIILSSKVNFLDLDRRECALERKLEEAPAHIKAYQSNKTNVS